LVAGRLDVVDGHTTIRATSELVGHLRNSDVAAVRVLEVHHSSPVVRGVFLELAGRASRQRREVIVRVHLDIEAVGQEVDQI
jgi:hypothetical protein